MRRLKYVLQSAIACFVVAGAMLVLLWGAGMTEPDMMPQIHMDTLT